MRKILYILILALLPLAPVERLDIAKLEPVQTVAVTQEQGQIVLETDTGNKGRGADVHKAVQDLRENTPGVIYLDTAEYLLVSEESLEQMEQLQGYFHSSVQVSLWDGQGSVEEAAKYLSVHGKRPKISQWRTLLESEK